MNPTKLELTFGNIRENTLWRVWVSGTSRKLYTLKESKYENLIYDTYWESYECIWQGKAESLKEDVNWHVPHFCSLGEWARNVTDLLTDDRYDELSFVDVTDQEFLFRYYVRLLLIVSEILADFDSILHEANLTTSNQQSARRKLLSDHINVHQLMQYINTVCKHKSSSNLHLHNHHLKYWFEDSEMDCPFANPISLSKSNFDMHDKPDGITVPSLASIVIAITDGYATLGKLFEQYPEKFNDFCLKVGDEYEEDDELPEAE